MSTIEHELEAFARGDIDPARLSHREHVRLAYEMLGQKCFLDAVSCFVAALQQLAARIGGPELYHATITFAFLALIAERRTRQNSPDWPSFAAANADLLEKRVLEHWYDPELLTSKLARSMFVMPAPRAR